MICIYLEGKGFNIHKTWSLPLRQLLIFNNNAKSPFPDLALNSATNRNSTSPLWGKKFPFFLPFQSSRNFEQRKQRWQQKVVLFGGLFCKRHLSKQTLPWQVWGFAMEQKNKPSYCCTVKMVFFPAPKGVSRSEWEDFQCGLKKGRWSLEKREGQIKKNVLLVGWTLCNIRKCF